MKSWRNGTGALWLMFHRPSGRDFLNELWIDLALYGWLRNDQ